MIPIDWGVFWGAAGAIVGFLALVATMWLGLRRRSFGLKSVAVLDTPRRAIRVMLTARGPGEVKSVQVVYGASGDIYPTVTVADQDNKVPFTFSDSGGKVYLTLRPAGDDPARAFSDDTTAKLNVYIDTSRKPQRIPIQYDPNVEWPDPVDQGTGQDQKQSHPAPRDDPHKRDVHRTRRGGPGNGRV